VLSREPSGGDMAGKRQGEPRMAGWHRAHTRAGITHTLEPAAPVPGPRGVHGRE
jgi:hypothetical protein